MPTHVTESTGASITATWEFSTGTLQVSSAGTFQVDTIAERTAGSGVTIDGVVVQDGGVTLTAPLHVSSGGTSSATAAGARTNLGAAASGANSDITSLAGLTTPLTVAQGGTGAASQTANGLLYGNGAGAIQVTAAGTSSQFVTANASGTPIWQPQIEYIEVVCNAPATSNTAVSDVVRFHFPFGGYVQTAACGVSTAPTGTPFMVDVHNGTTSFFSTRLCIDPGEFTSQTATKAVAINTATSNFSAWDTCRVHVDSQGIASSGLWVTLVTVKTS